MKMKKILPIICAVALVAAMTYAAVLLDNREIIFPEIAAIAVGVLVSPQFSWNANKLRIFIYITVCAILGVAIVKWLPLPVWAQMITAFLLAQILLANSKTSFAPMISALVLPVMLQTDTVVYFRFVAAPPLLVAFTEFSNPASKARIVPVKSVALITLCGLFGAALRWFFCIKLIIMPLYVTAVMTIICVILLMKAMKLYIPPAGAVSILAMLIPESSVTWFPLQIFIGASFIMLISVLFFKEKKNASET